MAACGYFSGDSVSHSSLLPLDVQDFLGQAFCTLGEIVGSSGSRLEKPLT